MSVITRAARLRWRLDWPLLGKELLEQAARKQMYVLRVAYALLLFGAFCFYYFRQVSDGSVLALGRGVGPFGFIVGAQYVAILLFLPPIMASAIASEKERETLGLLFLTDLTPWELILQKYFGRLIPMLTLLLLSLPLMAVSYSLGGVSIYMLASSAISLFTTCMAVGAVALESSVHQASTFQALLRCWGICAGFGVCCFSGAPSALFVAAMPANPAGLAGFLFLGPAMHLAITLFFLRRARMNLEARAFIPRRNPFEAQFKLMDQYWVDIRKLLRGIVRSRDRDAYADAAEVVRRQVGRGANAWSLGAFLMTRMQVPGFLAAAVIIGTLVLIYLIANVFLAPADASFHIAVKGFWLLALLTVPILSANVVSRERTSDRLAPLLTTPMPSREILDHWVASLRQWIRFIMWPLVFVIVLGAWFKFRSAPNDAEWRIFWSYLGASLAMVWVYPLLARWSCLWIGLRIKHQMRALMTALLATTAWCFVPGPLSAYLLGTGVLPERAAQVLKFSSPASLIRQTEMLGLPGMALGEFLTIAAIHLAVMAAIAFSIRWLSLRNADRYLGRL